MVTPKIIFQTWKTPTTIPLYLQKYQEKWKEYCRELNYKYKLYSDEDLRDIIAKYFPDYLAFYDGCTRNIERVDFSRYVILYLQGGAYADLDTIPLKNLDVFFSMNKPVLGCEPREHREALYQGREKVICNAFMISPPGHPLWIELMKFIRENYKSHGNPVYNTGPMAMTLFYEENPSIFQDTLITNSCVFFPITDTEYSLKSQGGFDHVSKDCDIENDSYVAHLWAHEWSSGFDPRFLDPNYWILGGMILLLIFLICYKKK